MTNPTTYAHESAAPTIIGDPLRSTGLTKRELFAALFVAALKSNPNMDYDCQGAAHDGLAHADALIAALNQGAE